jgi:DNA repair protein RadC
MTIEENQQGHRKRLREKFVESGLAGFQDYEIVELLLTLGSPRRDCKQQAREALKRFKTLRGVLEASSEELQQINGIGVHNSFGIKLVQEVARKYLKEKIIDKPVFSSSQEIFDYLYHSMRGLKKEVFKVIFLNSQNQIIETEDLFQGTVDSSVVHIREVIESAIKYHAVSLIFSHNHPSGNPAPSQSDKDLTRDLVMAAEITGLKVLDHIVIGDNKYYSFAGEGLIGRYETDFIGLKIKSACEFERGI